MKYGTYIQLMGYLTRDPIIHSGTHAQFTMCVRAEGRESYFMCTAWQGVAHECKTAFELGDLKKGSWRYVIGTIRALENRNGYEIIVKKCLKPEEDAQ